MSVGVASGVGVVGFRSKGCFEFCGEECGDECGDSGGGVPQSGGLGLLGVNLIERLGVSRILLLFLLLPQSRCGLIPVVLVLVGSGFTYYFWAMLLSSLVKVTICCAIWLQCCQTLGVSGSSACQGCLVHMLAYFGRVLPTRRA